MSDETGCGCLGGAGGLSLPTVLGIVFIVLKVTGKVDWSWLWVLSPFWIGYAMLFVFCALFFGGLAGIAGLFAFFDRKK